MCAVMYEEVMRGATEPQQFVGEAKIVHVQHNGGGVWRVVKCLAALEVVPWQPQLGVVALVVHSDEVNFWPVDPALQCVCVGDHGDGQFQVLLDQCHAGVGHPVVGHLFRVKAIHQHAPCHVQSFSVRSD